MTPDTHATLPRPLARAMAELYARYSDAHLAVLVDFTQRGNTTSLEYIASVERGGAARDRG